MPIDRFNELPDLTEQYLEENGSDERWVTVQEFRRFNLTGENGHIIAAFLCGLMYKPIFLNFPSLFTVSNGSKLNTAPRSHPTGIW
jgi:hypothetical protein